VASSLLSRIVVPFPHISSDGTGNGPMISLRAWLITAHHSVSSLSDPALEASPCSRYLRPARDVDTNCTVRRDVHESMATKVRAHRAPHLLRGCVGRSHLDHTEERNDFVGCVGRSDRSAQRSGPCHNQMESMEGPREQSPNGRHSLATAAPAKDRDAGPPEGRRSG
jgi:hypothetical protein